MTDPAGSGGAWPTATANDWKGSGLTPLRKDGQKRGDRLDYATGQILSTPRASDGEKGGPNQSFGAGGLPLVAQASQWATPSVADTTGGRMSRSGDRSSELLLKGQAEALTTQWPTPTANMITGAGHEGRDGGLNLQTAVTQWPTPSASIANDGETPETWNARAALLKEKHGNGNGAGKPLTIMSQEVTSFLPAPATSPDGETSLPERRSLNPLFVEWLMGWPPGWTLLALPELIDSACSETALCRWKARMRSALFSLASPIAAPPAQLSLLEV